jgi:hypothetical protein
MAEEASRHLNIRFNGHAKPRIINASPESIYLVEKQNPEPTKKSLPKKVPQKKNHAIAYQPTENQNLRAVPQALTSSSGVIAVPASQKKMPAPMFANLNRIQQEAIKVQTIEAELNKEKEKLLVELKALEKEMAEQEQEWSKYFNTVRQEMARLTSK